MSKYLILLILTLGCHSLGLRSSVWSESRVRQRPTTAEQFGFYPTETESWSPSTDSRPGFPLSAVGSKGRTLTAISAHGAIPLMRVHSTAKCLMLLDNVSKYVQDTLVCSRLPIPHTSNTSLQLNNHPLATAVSPRVCEWVKSVLIREYWYPYTCTEGRPPQSR